MNITHLIWLQILFLFQCIYVWNNYTSNNANFWGQTESGASKDETKSHPYWLHFQLPFTFISYNSKWELDWRGICVVPSKNEMTKWTISIQGRSTFVFSHKGLYISLVCVEFAKKWVKSRWRRTQSLQLFKIMIYCEPFQPPHHSDTVDDTVGKCDA